MFKFVSWTVLFFFNFRCIQGCYWKVIELSLLDISKFVSSSLLLLEATKDFRGKNSKWHDFCWFCLLGVLLITKKNPNKIPRVKTCFLAVFSKWPLLIYCNITKNARIINDTSFPTFLGSRNPMKVLFLRSEFNFTF